MNAKQKSIRVNPRRRMRSNPDLFDGIRPGDRVTIVDRFGKERTGRATIINRKDDVVVLNMGGPHGTPGIATRDNVVRVTPGKKGQRGGFVFNKRRGRRFRRNSHVKGADERTIARLVKRHGAMNVVGEAYEQGGKRVHHNPMSKKEFEFMAAVIADAQQRNEKQYVVAGMITLAIEVGKWSNPRFDEDKFLGRIRQLTTGDVKEVYRYVSRYNRNPQLAIVGAMNPPLGTAVELRYKRTSGQYPGNYKHKFTSRAIVLAMKDGSLRIVGR